MTPRLSYSIERTCDWSGARAGRIFTPRGEIETPIFMPVATQAALRGIDHSVTGALDYQVLLANTYHLLLRPGAEVFEHFGGIHKFMNWPGHVLTDSGGFQIFSLSRQLRISEEGARFKSYVDGAEVLLTPEVSIAMQKAIRSDIMMVLDQCIDARCSESEARAALELTTRWARRSLAARGDSRQALFGIVQGACYPQLRKESADQITSMDFDGFALGGLAVGESREQREEMVEFSASLLPADKPRYLMGVGTPIDLLEAVKRGMDMFDCILPTSLAHQGVCYTSRGRIELSRGAFRKSDEPLDPECECSTCRRFSRGYLHHLIRAREYVADQILGLHNLTFYRTLMRDMRASLLAGVFRKFYEERSVSLIARDTEKPISPPRVRRKEDPNRLGNYQVVAHEDGFGRVRHLTSGEEMHPAQDPLEEALHLYIKQPSIVEKAKSSERGLRIWDVGLGAATNAMACIMEVEKAAQDLATVKIQSFERDLDPLRLALRHPGLFRHLRHAAPHKLLSDGSWTDKKEKLHWNLLHGDFLETLDAAEAPDIIGYDPFSYKVDSELWSVDAFEKLLKACRGAATRVYTYTASTSVRAAMLAAGWYVGAGAATGSKRETTIAYSPAAAASLSSEELLGARWLERWERSDAKFPFGADETFDLRRIAEHPQFRQASVTSN